MTIAHDQTNIRSQSDTATDLPNLASLSIAGRSVMVPLRPFSADEYHALGRIGIVHEDDHTELMNGVISVLHVEPSDPSVRTVTYGDTNVTLPIALRLFSSDEFERMVEAGIVLENERCELMDGEIIEMAALGSRHIGCIIRLVELFAPALVGKANVSPQNSIRLNDNSEPVPDFLVLQKRPDSYDERLERPEEVLLLVEVSDTTLGYDRNYKVSKYAENGISEVWLVNLLSDVIEVYVRPDGASFSEKIIARRGESIKPINLQGMTVYVDDILGKARS